MGSNPILSASSGHSRPNPFRAGERRIELVISRITNDRWARRLPSGERSDASRSRIWQLPPGARSLAHNSLFLLIRDDPYGEGRGPRKCKCCLCNTRPKSSVWPVIGWFFRCVCRSL